MGLLSLVIFLVGLAGALMLLGLIGRSVKCPPHCRRCGYSLIGSSEAEQCPECSASLSAHDAVSCSRRQRRPRMAIAGAVMLLLACAPFATRFAGVNPYNYAPASWLMRSASKGNAPTAIDELLDRLKNGNLTRAQVTALVEAALVVQADMTRKWDADWGNIIETADANGLVTPQQMARYAKVAAESGMTLSVRPKVRKGDPIPYRFKRLEARVGDKGFYVRIERKMLKVDDVELPLQASHGGTLSNKSRSGAYGSREAWHASLDHIEPGEVPVAVTMRYLVYRVGTYNRQSPPPALYESDRTYTDMITITDTDQPTAHFIDDPSAAAAMTAAFNDPKHYLDYRIANDSLNITINVRNAPYASAFDVSLEHDGKRRQVAKMYFPANANSGFGTGAWGKDLKGDVVDIVLEPSLEAAASSMDHTAIWGERIVIKDVPVMRRP